MKQLLASRWSRWILGLALGVLFVWLGTREWPMDRLFHQQVSLQGSLLVVGDAAPHLTGPMSLDEVLSGASLGRPDPEDGWRFDLWALLSYGFILVVIHFLRVWRWEPLLQPFARVDFWALNRVGAVGFMTVFLFPLRIGELVRPYLLVREARVGFSEVLGTIVVERVMDGLSVSLLLFAVLFFLPESSLESYGRIRAGAWISLAVFLCAIAVLLAAWIARERTLEFIRGVGGVVSKGLAGKVAGLVDAFITGCGALGNFGDLFRFTLLTCVYWAVNGYGIWIFARAFGLDVPLLAGYAMMSCVIVGMMIPNSPGNVGSFWYFLLLPLEIYGVPSTSLPAIAFALGLWAAQTLQMSIFGCWFLVGRRRVKMGAVLGAARDGT